MNGNGGIDYNEFLTVAAKKESLLADENLEQAFKKIDSNNDGFITQGEIFIALGIEKGNTSFWTSFTGDLEIEDKERISYNEFKAGMMELAMPFLKQI